MTNVYIDVTNTVKAVHTTGIQRVTKEVVRRLLDKPNTSLQFILLINCSVCNNWFVLNNSEIEQLITSDKAAGKNSLLRVMVSTAFHFSRRMLSASLIASISDARQVWRHPRSHKKKPSFQFESGSIFFELESAWHNVPTRDVLLPQLSASGLKIVTFLYDVMPIKFPEYFEQFAVEKFKKFLNAHLKYSSAFICISRASERDLLEYAGQVDAKTTNFSTTSIQLGVDHTRTIADQVSWPLPSTIQRYILCVSTIEPRKNHNLLLAAFEKAAQQCQDVALVLVGKKGWKSNQFIQQLKQHPLWQKRIFWFCNINDATLSSFYKRAHLVVIPSLYEGLGLPVVEALNYGCVTLCSNTGGLPEAGGLHAIYFDPRKKDQLIQVLKQYLHNNKAHEQKSLMVRAFKGPSWNSTISSIIKTLESCGNL